MPRRLLLVVVLVLAPVPAAAATVASVGDASITHDTQARTWSIAAGGATLTLGLDPSRDFEVLRLVTAADIPWTIGALSDSSVTVDGKPLAFGSRAAGFVYRDTATFASGRTLRLDAVFDLAAAGLRVTRHYVVAGGSPTFETWTTFTPIGGAAATISNLNGFQLTVPAGAMHWLTGLQGDNADVEHNEAFTLKDRELGIGERLELGAAGRSSEQAVPWFAIDGRQEEFYAALMWSGAWALTALRSSSGVSISFGLASMTTALNGKSVDGPRALFGVVNGGLSQASGALRSYVLDGVRDGRPLTPLVTYNTWFAYGTEIDDASMRAEMERAAAMGVELFVLDAGWYAGAGAADAFDFDSGLGTWEPDPDRFPDGLRPLTDYAHSLGMKFGLWVEPERVNLSNIGSPGVDERWLATRGGNYGDARVGQICIAGAAARQWVLDQLTALIDAVQPDYLKWDNNFWINCDRAGHGHGTTDGNFAHVNALYELLGELRTRYPNLLIENVSGGGNRLDLGMVRYTDVAWMDDRTAPSVHVRHNVEGLSVVFPPAYLLSFVTNHETEPLHDAPDMALYFRSRMTGALGLCFRGDELSEGDVAEMSHEIDIYKVMRDTLSSAASTLLTAQAAVQDGPAWDVLQESVSDGRQALVCAFQTDDGVRAINVKPAGLAAAATYEVRSADTGVLGTATGADLMEHGIDLVQSPNTAAHILFLKAR
jgi:alpha-galactosidase